MSSEFYRGNLDICDENGKSLDTIKFTFNPSSYRIASTPRYKDVEHLSTDEVKKEFVGGVTRIFSCELLFDSYSDYELSSQQREEDRKYIHSQTGISPVTDKVQRLENAAHVEGSMHKPPLVVFSWGNLEFHGIISDLSIEYTMFNIQGEPIRAKVSLTLAEIKDPVLNSRRSPFESPDRTKSKVVVMGMSLWSIAWEEYNDCEKWRLIAKANNIMNPMDIYPGQVIRIPALD